MAQTKGIDISRYQGAPDFAKLKGRVGFVILQAGYGRYSSQKDAQFERSYAECKKHGIPVGAYWFGYAMTPADAAAEARACIEALRGKQFEYPIYYDMETDAQSGHYPFTTGRANCSAMADAFCSTLEEAGYFAGIYISRSPAQSYLTAEIWNKYALWLAEYGSKLNWSSTVGIWQNSSTGHFAGIPLDDKGRERNVDTDICYVDYPTIIKSAGLNGFPKQEPEPMDTDTWYKRGDKDKTGEHTIFAIKQRLKSIGYKVDDTGGFGGGTEAAVMDVQRKMGYKPTGEIGENFVKKLME